MKKRKLVLPRPITQQALYAMPDAHELSPADLLKLTTYEREQVVDELTRRLLLLRGEERDTYQQYIEALFTEHEKSEVWEANHAIITAAINNLIRINGCMPGKAEVCKETGLSRMTVYRHLKEYKTSVHYYNQIEQLKYLSSDMMVKVHKRASDGDNTAARLFFNLTGDIGNLNHANNQLIGSRVNYLKTPNLIITQEKLDKIPEAHMSLLESIIRNANTL